MAGWLREVLFRDVLIAVIVGLMVGLVSGFVITRGQAEIDDARAEREMTAARELADQAERLENLRFVRDRSSGDSSRRLFTSLDLSDVTLGPLNLTGSHFDGATLNRTRMDGANLADGVFTSASMTGARGRGTNFVGADFAYATLDDSVFAADFREASMQHISAIGANFQHSEMEGADLKWADLRGANLYDTGISESAVEGSCHDADTEWPLDFNPPPSADLSDCGSLLIIGDPAPPIIVRPSVDP